MDTEFRRKLKKAGIKICKEIFQYLLILFLLTLLIKEFFPDYVEHYVNVNYFMILVIIFGVVTVLTYKEPKLLEKVSSKDVKKEKVTRKDYYLIVFLGIVGSILIYIKTREIGKLSYLISIIAGILIILLSKLVLEED